jgi:hypothetical protein
MIEKAANLLRDCEQNLRKLLADAAGQGDYAAVLRITDWAKGLSALVAEGRSIEGSIQLPGAASPRNFSSTAGHGAGTMSVASAAAAAGALAGTSAARSRSPARDYPRFFRRGDELVKVGWSKKDRREYAHRAPRRAVDAVGAVVRVVGARRKLFNGDALLPLKDPADGSIIPGYQAYVALAWLTQLGLLKQHGRRGGYSLTAEKQIDNAVAGAWGELVEWRV